MNTGAGSNARELRNVEVTPVRTGRILSSVGMHAISLVSAGSLGHGGWKVVVILGMHGVIKHHALVKASIGGWVVVVSSSVKVLLVVTIMIIVV